MVKHSLKCHDSPPDVESRRDVVGGGVHLDDLDGLVGHLLAQLVVDGRQLLAVSAPRRVEHDEDTAVFTDEFVKSFVGQVNHLAGFVSPGHVGRLGLGLWLGIPGFNNVS